MLPAIHVTHNADMNGYATYPDSVEEFTTLALA